jgi:hypothetical protein
MVKIKTTAITQEIASISEDQGDDALIKPEGSYKAVSVLS